MSTLIRFLLGSSLVLTSLFLILLVLIQRGRGGGLAGAFGGMGGQSAFGTKAGDVFTKITVGVAFVWILLCILTLFLLGKPQSLLAPGLGGAAAPPVSNRPQPDTPPDATPAVPETTPEPSETKPAETTPAETKPDPAAVKQAETKPDPAEPKPVEEATGQPLTPKPPAEPPPAAQPDAAK